MTLREWMILYVKHRDALQKKLRDVKEEQNSVRFQFSEYVLTGLALDELRLPKIEGKTIIVTLQKKENIDFFVREWKAFAAHPDLTVVFANPKKNEKWVIKPALHDKISDGPLEQGIMSMAEGVSYV